MKIGIEDTDVKKYGYLPFIQFCNNREALSGCRK